MNLGLLVKAYLFFITTISFIFFTTACGGSVPTDSSQANNEKGKELRNIEWENSTFQIEKGISIGGYLSQTGGRLVSHEVFFNQQNVQMLADLGFDHIRLPVDELVIFTKTLEWEPGVKDLIHQTLLWCKESNMRVILDLHILRSHYFNNEQLMTLWTEKKEQDRFVEIWGKISEEFKKYPTSLLAYELLNQPAPPGYEVWNNLSARTIKKIREVEPKRTILLASGKYGIASALKTLTVPNDSNIMLSIHFNTPQLLTHYRSPWRKSMRDLNVKIHYPGQLVAKEDVDTIKSKENLRVVNFYNAYYDKEVLKSRLQDAFDKAKATGLKIHVSEFGCIEKTDRGIKRRWFKDVVEIFNENNISYSVWGYKSSYGLFDNNGNLKDEELIEILTNN